MIAAEHVLVRDLVLQEEAELTTGPFGTQLKAGEYVKDGTPLINVRNVGFGEVRVANLEYLSDETARRLDRHRLEAGDIVFGRKGAVERHAFISNDQVGWVQGSDCLRLRLRSPRFLPRFVSYFLLTEHHKQWMKNHCSGGATMASLNQDILGRIALPLVAPATQRKIAASLAAYDDLINNNDRRIRLLEEMAQRVYREWFVDFRYPGHENVPLVDSELGPIPQGWKVGRLADLVEVNRNTIGKIDTDEDIRYIDIASVTRGAVERPKRMRLSGAPGRARRRVAEGDIIWSTVRPNLRAYALLLSPGNDCVASTGFVVLSPRRASFAYVYAMTTTDAFVEYLVGRATGSAYPAVTPPVFVGAPALVPPGDVLEAFADAAESPMRLAACLRAHTDTLRASRDLLLPRLMSGEIDVSTLDVVVPWAAA